ncbi:hypothetical protein BH11PSE4_BH11PSE4_28250 [soil metagenome]
MDATTTPTSLKVPGGAERAARGVRSAIARAVAGELLAVVEIFKKTPCVSDLKPGGRDVAKDMQEFGDIIASDIHQGFADGKLTDAELVVRNTNWTRHATDHMADALWTYAQQVGPAVDRAVIHPGGRMRNSVMRASRRIILVALALASTSVAGPALAFDGVSVGGSDTAMPVASAQPGTAAALKKAAASDNSTSLTALHYAAAGGHPIAQWRLGRMYADGNGVMQDDLRAFEYFSRIANAHAEDSPSAPQAAVVANAFVALGRYYLDGIPNSKIKVDTERAREMFSYAASYFGNADAQYDLARLYLKGIGAPRDTKYGARWLGLAAQKGQHQAQAMLGQMLFNGEQLPRQAARGLMWLTLARDSATPDETWIKDSYNKAITKASEDDRAMALQMLEHWVQGRKD